jgi:hypothetical protein
MKHAMRYRLLLVTSLLSILLTISACKKRWFKNSNGNIALQLGDSLIQYETYALTKIGDEVSFSATKNITSHLTTSFRAANVQLQIGVLTNLKCYGTPGNIPIMYSLIKVYDDQMVGDYYVDSSYADDNTIVLDEIKGNGRCIKGHFSLHTYAEIDTTWNLPMQYFPDTLIATNVPFTI